MKEEKLKNIAFIIVAVITLLLGGKEGYSHITAREKPNKEADIEQRLTAKIDKKIDRIEFNLVNKGQNEKIEANKSFMMEMREDLKESNRIRVQIRDKMGELSANLKIFSVSYEKLEDDVKYLKRKR